MSPLYATRSAVPWEGPFSGWSKARRAMEKKGQRNLSLDVLRGLAVVLVLGRHMPVYDSSKVMTAWRVGGWVGVDIFFVLSGFLISGLLFREYSVHGRLSILRFYIRRGFKIYPPFYVMLFTGYAGLAWFHYTPQPIQMAGEVFFLQNYLGNFWGHTWSLAVEEHFYLLLPLLLALLIRAGRGKKDPFSPLIGIFIGLALFEMSNRVGRLNTGPYSHDTALFPTHYRLDGLFFGVLLSYLWSYRRELFQKAFRGHTWVLRLGGLALLAPPFVYELTDFQPLTSPDLYVVGLTANYLGAGAILTSVLIRPLPANVLTEMMACIGRNSYAIYLWHIPVLRFLPSFSSLVNLSPNFIPQLTVFLCASFLIGVAATKLVEDPILRLRDRLYPSNASSALKKRRIRFRIAS